MLHIIYNGIQWQTSDYSHLRTFAFSLIAIMNHWGEKHQVRVWRQSYLHIISQVSGGTHHLGKFIPTVIYIAHLLNE